VRTVLCCAVPCRAVPCGHVRCAQTDGRMGAGAGADVDVDGAGGACVRGYGGRWIEVHRYVRTGWMGGEGEM
jgi:hypothetical protein